MAENNNSLHLIPVEVAYASTDQSWLLPSMVEKGTTVRQAIVSSGILKKCPDINLQINKVGIFGQMIALNIPLKAGDRIEIYRPLLLDPKEARRLRAVKNKQRVVHNARCLP